MQTNERCRLTVQKDELEHPARAAFVTAVLGLRCEVPDAHYVLLHMGKGDATQCRMSVFSYNTHGDTAAHFRVRLRTGSELPPNAYVRVKDLAELVSWLKPLPKGDVIFTWLDDGYGSRQLHVQFVPDKSSKTFESLKLDWPEVNGLAPSIRAPFNMGRDAYRNAHEGRAVRLFGKLTLGPLVIQWLGNVYGGRSIDLVPFDKGNKLYIRSDFATNTECVCSMPYPAK